MILGFLLIVSLFVYASFNFILKGPTAPLFVINNLDVNGHEVTVEVSDQNKKLIVNETYNLEPEGDVSQSRPFISRYYQEKKEYTFKVTMDKQITKTVKAEIPDRHTFVYIYLYYNEYGSPEIIPVFMVTTEYC
ncbi:hypothetical protein MSSIT_0215 [Methanosarcina siciliae T4/M]|uniref:Uncharacterized protein n=3 Tax=Methanosarcina siciliae TaxID=38027 RepID=A0A0E3L9U9_9EURY|nr:hypothetical protein MSSIT_0215 [Methanosarcina siciliae T4/M]AKB30901.1 hypothetical protein MSSIH_0211 [Methanosarcina siciliae HI350]